jgi:hypothetical protein
VVGEHFSVEGYVVEELIGSGGSGEVWRGRDLTSGDRVALKRLRGPGPASIERLRREATLLATVAGPHVVGLRGLLVEDDHAVLVMDLATGGSLAGVLATRGRLSAPEVVTILAPIASAVAAAHARDLVHGDLTPANILFTTDGRPLLADFGVAHAVGALLRTVQGTLDYLDPAVVNGAPPTPASDVFALGAVGYAALAGTPIWGSGSPDQIEGRSLIGIRTALDELVTDAPAALVEVIDSALALDPDDRPDARSFARAVLHSGAAAPVRLVTPVAPAPTPLTQPVRSASAIVPPPVRPDERESKVPSAHGQRIALTVAAVLALAGAVGLGVALGRHGGSSASALTVPQDHGVVAATPTASRSASPDPPLSWQAVVAHLDELRAAAFDAADPDQLSQVYTPGAAAYATDRATVDSLKSRGLHARGFHAVVVRVTADSMDDGVEQLSVVDRLTGYDLVDATGRVVGHGAARPSRTFTLWLTDVAGTWRVSRIRAT